jgi:hypothetical protein
MVDALIWLIGLVAWSHGVAAASTAAALPLHRRRQAGFSVIEGLAGFDLGATGAV